MGAGAAGVHGALPGTPSPSSHSPMYYDEERPRLLRTGQHQLTYIETDYAFGIVADLDLDSRDPQEFIWRSYLKKGFLLRLGMRDEAPRFTIAFDQELELRSSTATRNRSMELSELVRYHRTLMAFCDSSGLGYRVDPNTGKVFMRWAIADGDGNEPKPFKTEWATIKDNSVWLGSIGFEWYGADGNILHRNAEYVKTIDANGGVHHLNWHPVYQTIRTATNMTVPGYLWHEAVEWEPVFRRWVMLPRFGSNVSRYVPGDETKDAVNLLIVANEFFTDIHVRWLDNHDPRFAFSAIRKLPGSQRLFMVLRVSEGEEGQHSQAAVIDLDGRFYTDPPYIDVGSRKFEGLAFL